MMLETRRSLLQSSWGKRLRILSSRLLFLARYLCTTRIGGFSDSGIGEEAGKVQVENRKAAWHNTYRIDLS